MLGARFQLLPHPYSLLQEGKTIKKIENLHSEIHNLFSSICIDHHPVTIAISAIASLAFLGMISLHVKIDKN